MKRKIYIATTITLALMFSSCMKEDMTPVQENQDFVTIELNASDEIVTRTHYDNTQKIKWNETGEELQIIESDGQNLATGKSNNTVVENEGRTARFTVKMPVNTAASLDYWGIYPACNHIAEANTNPDSYKIRIPQTQKPVAGSFDPNADLLVSNKEHQTAQPESMDFYFNRPASVVELVLQGITAGEKISSITVSNTQATLAGEALYNLNTNAFCEGGLANGSKSIKMEYTDFTATGDDKAMFITYPAELSDLEIQVITDQAIYSMKSNAKFALNANRKRKLTAANLLREPLNLPAPEASFTVEKSLVQLNTPLQFTDASKNATRWAWDFGDGTSSTEQNPAHKYTMPGLYTVKLTVSNPGGSHEFIMTAPVTAYGKKADGYVLTYEVKIDADNTEHIIGRDEKNTPVGVPQFTGTVYYGEKSIEMTDAKEIRLTFDKAGSYLVSLKGYWNAKEKKDLCPMNNQIVRLVHVADLLSYRGNWRATKPTGLKSIEPGFFDECPRLNSIENAFFGAGKLTVIPAGLLAKLPRLIKANSAFRETGIESVPAGLFDNNPELETLDYAFNNSPNLTTIPSGLFKNNKKLAVTSGAFRECRKLTSDISALFSEPCASLENVKNMFNGCPALTGNAQKIWDTAIFTNPKLQDPDPHAGCFKGCGKLSNFKDIPDEWKL